MKIIENLTSNLHYLKSFCNMGVSKEFLDMLENNNLVMNVEHIGYNENYVSDEFKITFIDNDVIFVFR